ASDAKTSTSVVDVLVAPIGEEAALTALVLGRDVRRAGIRCEVDTRKASVKAQLRRANTLGARVAIILGERELAEGTAEVKDLAARTQEKVKLTELAQRVRAIVDSPAPPAAAAEGP